MKIVHAADIHLDSPLRGLEKYDGAPKDQLRNASRRAVEHLVELCLVEGANLLLIAGDLYDGHWRDYNTGLFFASQMAKLCAADIYTVIVRGNHDAENPIATKLKLSQGAGSGLKWRLNEKVIELGTQQPETKILEDLGVAIHGQSFPSKAVSDDLAIRYPNPISGLFNIGLLHTSVNGREGHEPYAPCSLQTLIGKGYDYWALGHVHKREVLCEDPWIVFPGNLQGRHIRETGEKGATLITVEEGRVKQAVHRTLDAVRWALCEVDIAKAASAADVVDHARETLARALEAADGRPLAARVVLSGSGKAHAELAGNPEHWAQQIRGSVMDIPGEGLWVEKVKFKSRTALDVQALLERDDAVGQLLRFLRGLPEDQNTLREMIDELADLRHKLPQEIREGDEGIRLDDPAVLVGLLEDVEQTLLPRLLQGGPAR